MADERDKRDRPHPDADSSGGAVDPTAASRGPEDHVPEAVEHVGAVDEIEAAIVRGAAFAQADDELPGDDDRNGSEDVGDLDVDGVTLPDVGPDAEVLDENGYEGGLDSYGDEGAAAEGAAGSEVAAVGGGAAGATTTRTGSRTGARQQTSTEPRGGERAHRAAEEEHHANIFARAIAFLKASWAELQRVQWPDRRHVFSATAVVLGFVVVAGVYLGVADWVAGKLVNLVI